MSSYYLYSKLANISKPAVCVRRNARPEMLGADMHRQRGHPGNYGHSFQLRAGGQGGYGPRPYRL